MKKEDNNWVLIEWSEKIVYIIGMIWLIISMLLIVWMIIIAMMVAENKKTNPTVDVRKDNKVGATTVNVGSFYDGSDGFSLSIPSGNTSTCVWIYAGGNASIPYTKTTNANTAKEKHILSFDYGVDDFYDFKVYCADDFGNLYIGVFPDY